MNVRYEWHWERLEADGSGDIIDFNYADTLNYLFRETSYQEVKKLIDKGTHSISLQKWCGLCEDELVCRFRTGRTVGWNMYGIPMECLWNM